MINITIYKNILLIISYQIIIIANRTMINIDKALLLTGESVQDRHLPSFQTFD